VPASKPELVIMVMVDEPRGGYYGGTVAAPAFREIARFNLQHLEFRRRTEISPALGQSKRLAPRPPSGFSDWGPPERIPVWRNQEPSGRWSSTL
jgi:hypothetical protein